MKKSLMTYISIIIYNILFTFLIIILSPFLLFKAFKSNEDVIHRLGLGIKPLQGKWIWFHASSFGETRLLQPIIAKLKEEYPDIKIILTTTTKAGNIAGKNLHPSPDIISYTPIDLYPCVYHFLSRINPILFVTTESEFWPNAVYLSKKFGAKVMLINGKLSDRTFGIMKELKLLITPLISGIDFIGTRNGRDDTKYRVLCKRDVIIKNIGELKFSSDYEQSHPIQKPDNRITIIACSIREGEEKPFVDVFSNLYKKHSFIKLLLAPRHRERYDYIESMVTETGIDHSRYTGNPDGFLSSTICILDTMGKLVDYLQVGNIAFVGGSMVDFGGHNPLEPAYFNLPIIMGPNFKNSQTAVEKLQDTGGIFIVNDYQELEKKLELLIKDEKLRINMGNKAKLAVESYSNIAKNYFAELQRFIE